MAKDLFSQQSAVYAKYRPTYPQELYDHILSFVPGRNRAWDCATGNGQAARVLAGYFKKVDATDISEEQISNAVRLPNIEYRICPAEQTPFEDHVFDLITIATAYHWLDWNAFHHEATRVGRPGAVVAAWGYNRVRCSDERITALIENFYFNIIYSYWDPERKFVDESYRTVAFDFDPLPVRDFGMELYWNKEAFKGYLTTWSAVQTYIRKHDQSPIDLIESELNALWNDQEEKQFYFPIFLKIGKTKIA